jgi:hypothetical protein
VHFVGLGVVNCLSTMHGMNNIKKDNESDDTCGYHYN